MSQPTSKTFLITGATGKQGRAVINALLASQEASSSSINIIALTRSRDSKSAQSLASHPNITVIEGDYSHPQQIFQQITQPIDGLYNVQINNPHEETQGKSLITAAASFSLGVRHIVYASADRGGPLTSDIEPTYVKNFSSKFAIEKHLIQTVSAVRARGGDMSYTILRLVTFFENLTPDIYGRGFARMWEQIGTEKKLQIVSVRDVGWFGAQALLHGTDDPEYQDKAISLAGDELTQPEADVIFRELVGTEMPMSPCLMGSAIKFAMSDTYGDEFKWFKENGYAADLSWCYKMNPKMQSFAMWLKNSSGFVKQDVGSVKG